MANKDNNETIQVLHPICCGLDVHKEKVTACLLTVDSSGQSREHTKEFSTFTDDLVNFREWVLEFECPVVAMESTSVYWHPIHNILEGFVQVVLVNARHLRHVPGRKTDMSDSRWLAGLLRHGLVNASFIPPKEIRQWRELVTLRRKIVENIADYKRRAHKLLESANIKIDCVATDLFGVSGRNLMEILIDDPSKLTEENVEKSLKGRLKKKAPEILRAVKGFFNEHHQFMLKSILVIVEHLEREVASLNRRLADLMSPHEELIDRLDEIPGIDEVAARAILAYVGPTMDNFANTAAFASWAGLCPGNNESAGKRHSGRIHVHNHPLKTLMVELSWAAVRTKNSYYQAKYYSLKARRGAKRAIVAIAHRLAKVIFHIIKYGENFQDLGPDYLVQLNVAGTLARIQKMAEKIGCKVVPMDA